MCTQERVVYDCDQLHESPLPTKVTKKEYNGITLQGEKNLLAPNKIAT